MTLNTLQILQRIDSTTVLDIRHLGGQLAFTADFDRIRELCDAGQVCGNLRGQHLRYLELLVPLSEATPISHYIERQSSGCVAQDSRTGNYGSDVLANVYSHNMRISGAYGGSRETYLNNGGRAS